MKFNYILSVILCFVVFTLTAQEKRRDKDYQFMLTEYYGQQEFQRKQSCCTYQIDKKKFILDKSFNLVSKLRENQSVHGTIEQVVFTPKEGTQYNASAEELIELINTEKFNILISDIKIEKNEDKYYKIGETGFFLIVYPEELTDKNFNLTHK